MMRKIRIKKHFQSLNANYNDRKEHIVLNHCTHNVVVQNCTRKPISANVRRMHCGRL